MAETYNLVVQGFGKRLLFACCNHECQDLCTVPHEYVTGRKPANYPVPAIPLRVTIDYEFVAIWRVFRDCSFYTDYYETVFGY